MRPACLAIFFLDLGLGDFCTQERLEPVFRRDKGVGSFDRLVSPAEGVSALALTHFNLMHARTWTGQTFTVKHPVRTTTTSATTTTTTRLRQVCVALWCGDL